jgi:hypothetical protein
MSSLAPLFLICGFTLFIVGSIWMAIRLVRWAKRGTKSGSLLGLAMVLPSAGANPQPPPQVYIEEVAKESRLKKGSASGDPLDSD